MSLMNIDEQFMFMRMVPAKTDSWTPEQLIGCDSCPSFSSILNSVYRLKVKGQDTCYSTVYMSQTQEQQQFTISDVAADWHQLMIPQRIMWPFIACTNGHLDP